LNEKTDDINFGIEKFSLDSNVIITFFNSNNDYILRGIFKGKIYLSSEILKEVKRYNLESFDYQILSIKTEEESEYFYQLSDKHISLSVADAQLITICKFNNLVCVSFEKTMRAVCRKDNIKNTGLLGILIEAIRLKIVDNKEATNLVCKLKENGLWLGENVLDEIIEAVDKFNEI
jgi:predicted nucleic acid-binding protein